MSDNIKTTSNGLNLGLKCRGFYRVSVVCEDGTIKHTSKDQDNLILDAGMDEVAVQAWFTLIAFAAAGTGTADTKTLVDGTASQTGTTVTLAGSSYSFVGGDVGSWLKWGTGQEAKITGFTNTTTVTVNRSQTVPSGALVGLFRCGRTALANEVVRRGNQTSSDTAIYPAYTDSVDNRWSQGFFPDLTAGTMTMRSTVDFLAEVGTVNYTEVGMGWAAGPNNLFSIINLAAPITVNATEKLRVQYNLVLTVPFTAVRPTNRTLNIAGWPFPYSITGITSSPTNFTVTTNINHHYLAAGKVNIQGAAVGAYDGEWTIASVTANTFTITSSINPGVAGAGGTVINNLKAGIQCCRWGFNAGISPGSNNYRNWNVNNTGAGWPVTNGNPGMAPDALNSAQGALASNINQTSLSGLWNMQSGTSTITSGQLRAVAYFGLVTVTPGAAEWSMGGSTQIGEAVRTPNTHDNLAYSSGDFYMDTVSTYEPGHANVSDIRSVFIAGSVSAGLPAGSNSAPLSVAAILIQFEEPQRKRNDATLTFTVRRSWSRLLA